LKPEYDAPTALRLLMAKLTAQSPVLAERIQPTVDAGKAVQKEEFEGEPGKKRKKRRRYWQTEPYSPAEALQVAVRVLRAHLVETPWMIASAADDFTKSGEASPKPIVLPSSTSAMRGFYEISAFKSDFESSREPKPPEKLERIGEPKALVIEPPPSLFSIAPQSETPLELRTGPDFERLKTLLGELEKLITLGAAIYGDTR
jgi:hypothetical protein